MITRYDVCSNKYFVFSLYLLSLSLSLFALSLVHVCSCTHIRVACIKYKFTSFPHPVFAKQNLSGVMVRITLAFESSFFSPRAPDTDGKTLGGWSERVFIGKPEKAVIRFLSYIRGSM